jgi:hypothetical protein
VIRRHQQALGRRLHRRGALCDDFDDVLDPAAERGNIGIDGDTAHLPQAQRIALPLGGTLLCDVGMRRDPAAAGQRLKDQCDGATVPEVNCFCFGVPRGCLLDAIGDVLIGIAGERARLHAPTKNLAHRHALPETLPWQPRHFDIAQIAQDEPARAIEHAQALRHVVERNPRQKIAPAFLRDGDKSADRQEGKRQQRR